ncbi:MAG: hypothetical protein A2X11_02495 [Bacteroidetes bacterium GWE2_42_24]|nr:MAG: hypothetical protein A2X11_02495 [Bacteroidetes bacterium GWE2_42_24]
MAIVALFAACSKDETTTATDDKNVALITDKATLNKMITYVNEPITLTGGLKATASIDLVAILQSPTINGVKLSATSTIIRNNIAYVTFHERGNGFGGALVAFDVTNPAVPLLQYYYPFSEYDINASDISADGSKMYLAGGSNKKGAVLLVCDLDGAGIPSIGYTVLKIGVDAPSANGVVQGGNWIYVSAGHSNGGLFAFKKADLAPAGEDLYEGASFSAANGRAIGDRHVALEGGDVAQLHVYTIGSDDPAGEAIWPIGSISHQGVEPENEYHGKGTVYLKDGSDVCYIAMGQYGMKAIDITNGNLVYTATGMITYGNTNAVSADDDYVYMANGAQGLGVYEPVVGDTELSLVGVWDGHEGVNMPASCNFVMSNGVNMFVAFGKEGGLTILSK